MCRADQEERVAVSRRVHDRLGGDVATGARSVLDHDGLAKTLRQPLSEEARGDIGATPRRKSDNQPHRPYWIALRARDPVECRRERGNPGEAQKIPASVQQVMPAFGAAPDITSPGYFSNAAWALARTSRASPQICSEPTGFRLWGIAEDPF